MTSAIDVGVLGRAVVGRKLGLLGRVRVLPRLADEANVVHVVAQMAERGLVPGSAAAESGGATHADADGAIVRGMMESIERYCGAFVDYDRLLLSRPLEYGPFLFGDALPLYRDEQYRQPRWPYRPLTRESEIHWIDARSIATGKRWLVPAGLVHVPYDFSIEAERLGPSTSTGMACHPSLTVAMLTGLFEVCERDAFAIAWLNRLSLPRLRFSARSRFGAELERIVAGGGRVEFVDLTNDLGVPVVLAKLERMLLGRPLVTVGLAARTTRTEAARKALMEAASEYRRLHDELTSPAATVWQPAERFANVSEFPWHSRVYVDPAMQPRLAFLTASPREEIVDDEQAPGASANVTLAASACRLADRGVDVLAVHLTTRDVAELGLHVVKIMAPQAVPLNPHHLVPWLGHRRIYTVPVALGHREREPTVDELNLADPHPFA